MREPDTYCDLCDGPIFCANSWSVSIIPPDPIVPKLGPGVDICVDCWRQRFGIKTVREMLKEGIPPLDLVEVTYD